MSELKQLPYLLALIDDESPATRRAVLKELSGYGKNLDKVLDNLIPPPSEAVRRKVQELLSHHLSNEKGNHWMNWLNEEDDYLRLEKAVAFLSSFQSEFYDHDNIKRAIDELATTFLSTGVENNIFELSNYLFVTLGYVGEKDSFYDPKNNDVAYVLKHKKGLPISLAIIYMLVGKSIGLTIEGFNYPGHFMAKSEWNGTSYLIDCFNHGEIFKENEFLQANVSGSIDSNRKLFKANSKIIVGRVLRNLAKAYETSGDNLRSRQVVDFLKELGS
jgi:regulator of sirC expression with transglutaminase-like and TPR domain